MGKGEETRTVILDHAARLASRVGLAGVTIGRLAGELELSKSGVFAHFDSKEALAVQVLAHARDQFIETVVAPALKRPRGEPRVRALFENWVAWGVSERMPGGCIFVAAAAELDDQPGAARDMLVQIQRDWIETLTQAARIAVTAGDFHPRLDPEQFAFQMYADVLGFHTYTRLLRDPKAGQRVRKAFDRLLENARSKP